MPRVAHIVLPGLPHHVIQRGNNRQDVFFVDDDRRAYLNMLAERKRPVKHVRAGRAGGMAFAGDGDFLIRAKI